MPGKSPRKEEPRKLPGLEEIREILDLLNEQGISEFEMEKDGFRVRIKRGVPVESAPITEARTESPHSAQATVPPHPAEVAADLPVTATSEAASEAREGLHVIKSPIVGTFFAAPGPEAPPFVKIGDVIQKGHVLCIIEAMKLMNEIEAEVSGEIAEIYVQNGQPVEYGQSLFGVIPSGAG